MAKRNGPPLTAQDRARIKQLHEAGLLQVEIARAIGRHCDSVRKVLQEMGLPTQRPATPVPEDKICELWHQGFGVPRIHEALHVSHRKVMATLKKLGLHRDRPKLKGDVAGFIAALREKPDYITRLAKKFGLRESRAQIIAREVLATLQFRPGPSKPPLSSDFPQKHFDRPAEPEDYIRIVDTVLHKCFGGQLPELPDDVFAGAIVHALRRDALAGQPEHVVAEFQNGLLGAIETMREAQQAPWRN
jgi:hypothetical protein